MMRKIYEKIAFVILLFSVCNLFAQNNRYDIKSGIVEYDILGTTNSKKLIILLLEVVFCILKILVI